MSYFSELDTIPQCEAMDYAEWLNAHGYEASVWHYQTALNNYGPANQRTEYANGYAVTYEGQLVRDDGSTAEYPNAGITVFCEDEQLPLHKLVSAGRALVTFDNKTFTPYYVAAYNPRETDKQRDPAINMGTLQTAILHNLTPLIGGDGPMRFYDIRMSQI